LGEILLLLLLTLVHFLFLNFFRHFPFSYFTITVIQRFLATHLPLIREKVKSILLSIAGTTANALGKIRQTLYDQTDGIGLVQKEKLHTWDDAINVMIDPRIVALSASTATTAATAMDTSSTYKSQQLQQSTHPSSRNRFSLWGALFSNTFSSLVNSILSTSFLSVHNNVISALYNLLQNAPAMEYILPHETYNNTLQIVIDLDRSLQKVSIDAYELLVHAEERIESERRLRQSLYIQTCEIIGRLLCDLRQMVRMVRVGTNNTFNSKTMIGNNLKDSNSNIDATKELIIGRLCYLLKFRLSSLRTLLANDASPAVIATTTTTTTATNTPQQQQQQYNKGGMISYVDLQSAFDLADDDQDGLISFHDAIDVVDSAFAGTPFHGTTMIRDTLFVSTTSCTQSNPDQLNVTNTQTSTTNKLSNETTNQTVTLNEFTLLTARGLRHDHGALFIVQTSLDYIIQLCFQRWAKSMLYVSVLSLKEKVDDFVECATTLPDNEWQRLFGGNRTTSSSIIEHNDTNTDNIDKIIENVTCRGVSTHIVAYVLNIGILLNTNLSPSDCLLPISSIDDAITLGIAIDDKQSMDNQQKSVVVPSILDILRRSLLDESFNTLISILYEKIVPSQQSHSTTTKAFIGLDQFGLSSLIQLYMDVTFIKNCYIDRDFIGYNRMNETSKYQRDETKMKLNKILQQIDERLSNAHGVRENVRNNLTKLCIQSHQGIFESSNLYISCLFGQYNARLDVSSDTMTTTTTTSMEPAYHLPLPSSRRFVLLPIQNDRSLADIQQSILRNKYKSESTATTMDDNHESYNSLSTSSGNVISGGFGFLSNMLKTKK
jgi:hypothetical protein